MFKFLQKDTGINAFMNGEFVALENVEDKVFSEKMMGDGFAIKPNANEVYAPVDGEVTVVFPTLHAYGFKMKNGVEVLLHLGINTVELNGEGFEALVKVNDKVKKGDLIAKMDLDLINEKEYPITSMCILTSGETIDVVNADLNVTKDTLIANINK
ncbi:MAG TPA: PTS glucose transporter subunit IIA [Erysipelothrix sp.]|nr:PTS glucose transporter subunit IIA [Erysipelothrix sp.]